MKTIMFSGKYFRNLFILCVSFSIISTLTSCSLFSEKDNSNKSLADLVKHFQKNGLKITSMQPLITAPVKAESGLAIMIGERQVGIYKYNLKKIKMHKKLERIKETGELYIIGHRFKAKVNGCFVLIDYTTHKQGRKIARVFDEF